MLEGRSFPCTKEVWQGEEYINMETKDFVDLFKTYCSYTRIPETVVDECFNRYNKAVSIKRTRIKNKKAKQALRIMINVMLGADKYNERKEVKVVF